MKLALRAFAYGLAAVVALFVGMLVPGVGGLAEWLLGPGYALPEAYWGAAHDPVQIFLAFALNVVFYTLAACAVLLLLRRRLSQRDLAR